MLQSEPDGASVLRDGIEVGRTPYPVAVGDRATRLELHAIGFQIAEALVGPEAGETVRVALTPESSGADPAPAARRPPPPPATKVRRPGAPDRGGARTSGTPSRPSGPYAPLDR